MNKIWYVASKSNTVIQEIKRFTVIMKSNCWDLASVSLDFEFSKLHKVNPM